MPRTRVNCSRCGQFMWLTDEEVRAVRHADRDVKQIECWECWGGEVDENSVESMVETMHEDERNRDE